MDDADEEDDHGSILMVETDFRKSSAMVRLSQISRKGTLPYDKIAYIEIYFRKFGKNEIE